MSAALRMPDGFQGAEYEALAAKSTARLLRAVGKRFEEAAVESPTHPGLVDEMVIRSAVLHVPPERRREFRRCVEALFDEFADGVPGDEQPVQALFALVPVLD